MDASNTLRIVLLGKTGSGKSSLANTILGKSVFQVNHFTNSALSLCQSASGSVNGRNITLVDTPGFFHAGASEQELRREIVRCVSECPPGPHAFLIVLKMEKFTEQESHVIRKISEYFSAEAFKYSALVFTHCDQLSEGIRIETFVRQNKHLRELVEKCGGRCYAVDNKYWKRNLQGEYRDNQLQVAELLETIQKMVKEKNGGCYTTAMLRHEEGRERLSINSIFKSLIRYTSRRCMKAFISVAVIIGVMFIHKMVKGKVAETTDI